VKPPAVDLGALARAVAPLVLGQLAAALGATQAPFTTRRGGEVPDEFRDRRKTWLATAPGIPGAVKLGRWWSVSRAAYAAWLASQAPTAAHAAPAAPWHPSQELPRLKLVAKGGA